MTNLLRSLALGAALGASGLAHGAKVSYVADYGDDGDARYFQVTCSDRRLVSVRVDAGTGKTCVVSDKGERCATGWTVRKAAEQACK
jgi:hypothetical protein